MKNRTYQCMFPNPQNHENHGANYRTENVPPVAATSLHRFLQVQLTGKQVQWKKTNLKTPNHHTYCKRSLRTDFFRVTKFTAARPRPCRYICWNRICRARVLSHTKLVSSPKHAPPWWGRQSVLLLPWPSATLRLRYGTAFLVRPIIRWKLFTLTTIIVY